MRLATFNCENLFARYKFRNNFDPTESDGFTINNLAFEIYDETEKQITARAIREVNADIIALQEVENLPVLDRFNSRYLGGLRYVHRMLVDSHDPRGIDVALLSRFPIVAVRSYRHERNLSNTALLFSRDCLEVDLDVDGKRLVIYVNHFKSMMDGRAATRARRIQQAERVAAIIQERWQVQNFEGNYVVMGDLNDYPEGSTSLGALLDHPGLVNVVRRLPEGEQWTHYFAGANEYRQLDYIFLSSSLANLNPAAPGIMRMGLPYRAERYAGQRFDNVGEDNPKASDHAPVFMDLNLA
jgi:endonuclease/exonuclease/phosphatase family metal-dependent hydrolase